MYALVKPLLFVTVLITYFGALAQQPFPDERYKINLTVAGKLVNGGQELASRLTGKTPAQQDLILDEKPPTLTRGQSFQTEVQVTDPKGVTKNFTQSPRLRYEHFGCLTVTTTGVVTATPLSGAACTGPDLPELWVVLTDTGGNPIAMNSYMFRVVAPPQPRAVINPPNCKANPGLCR
jgi:hypothetical protein